MNTSMFYGKLSDNFILLLDKLNLKECEDINDVLSFFKENESLSRQINNQITSFIESTFFQHSYDIKFHTLAITSPGIRSINYIENKNGRREYTGLHFDRSEIQPFGSFHKSKQRICINLGETRYVYFSPYSANEITSELYKKYKNVVFEDVLHLYKDHFSKEPIYIMAIPKGHFYIAPSDNVLHDGSSIYHNSYDVCAVFLGNFNIFCENGISFL